MLKPELIREIGLRPRKQLLERLAAAGIPCGEVCGLHEALTSQRAVAGGLVTTQLHPVAGTTPVMAPPYRFDGIRLPVRLAPPQLGEGTQEILQSVLGMSDEGLAQLRSDGVI